MVDTKLPVTKYTKLATHHTGDPRDVRSNAQSAGLVVIFYRPQAMSDQKNNTWSPVNTGGEWFFLAAVSSFVARSDAFVDGVLELTTSEVLFLWPSGSARPDIYREAVSGHKDAQAKKGVIGKDFLMEYPALTRSTTAGRASRARIVKDYETIRTRASRDNAIIAMVYKVLVTLALGVFIAWIIVFFTE